MLKRLFILILFSFLAVSTPVAVQAQCAMCTATADNMAKEKGESAGKGLNNAILMLMAMPYVAVGVIGFVYIRKRRKAAAANR